MPPYHGKASDIVKALMAEHGIPHHPNCRSTIVSPRYDDYAKNEDATDGDNAIATALAAGAALGTLSEVAEGLHVAVVPDGYTAKPIDTIELLAKHQPRPDRLTGEVELDELDSLLGYLDRHSTDDTTVWADVDRGRFEAVINDHGKEAGHGDHRAVLRLQPTPEWLFWLGQDGKLMAQEDFAEHIEDGQRELHEPDPSVMLDIAQSFQATTDAKFASATRVQDGQVQLAYAENVQAKAGVNGDIAIPATFKLAVAPFPGCPAYALTARFRWRLREGKLTLGYKLDRPADVKRDAIKAMVDTVLEKHPGRAFLGRPR